MRAAFPAAAALALAVFAIFLGGRLLAPGAPEAGSAAGNAAQTSRPVQVVTVEPPAPGWRLATAPIPDRAPDAARVIAPAVVAPPALDPSELKWAEPRAPLSELAQARPPKPKPPGNTVFRPLAMELALVQTTSGGHVEIAGTVSLPAEETCDFEGTIWACGLRARTAFRMWLRGRALDCDVPPDPSGLTVISACRLGKQDAGAWLVSNGWARAELGGPYAELEERARSAHKGIFGPPPNSSGLAEVPDFTASAPDQPVLVWPPAFQ